MLQAQGRGGRMGEGLQGPLSCSLLPRGSGGRCPSWGSIQVYRSEASRREGRNRDQMPGVPELGTYPAQGGWGLPPWGVQTPSVSCADEGTAEALGSTQQKKDHQPISRPSVLWQVCCVPKWGAQVGAWGGARPVGGAGTEGCGQAKGGARGGGRVREVGGASEPGQASG